MQSLNFSKSNYEGIKRGKRTTIRLGAWPSMTLGPAAAECRSEMTACEVEITEIRQVRLRDLGLAEAVADGFNSKEELREELERCYEKCISGFEPVTVFRFKLPND